MDDFEKLAAFINSTIPTELRKWELPIGPFSYKKGESYKFMVRVEHHFRGEVLTLYGCKVKIKNVLVGSRLMYKIDESPVFEAAVDPTALEPDDTRRSCKLTWPVAVPGQSISFTIEFLEEGTYDGIISGTTAL